MRLSEIAELILGELLGDADLEITGVKGIEDAGKGEIAYAEGKKAISGLAETSASCIIVSEFLPGVKAAQIKVGNPQYAWAVLLGRFFPPPLPPKGIDPLASVSDDAQVAPGVSVGPFVCIRSGASVAAGCLLYPGVYVGENSSIGEDSVIYPNVVIREGVSIGKRAIIHPGAVVGADGFGYVVHEGARCKIPQVGGVVMGDDVEIGANVTIDRATTGNTVLGNGVKIDNLVQVAHNVTLGDGTVIVAQVGIAGSCNLGKGVIIGGQVGIADHVNIADGTMVAAQSGVMRDLKRGVYLGSPVYPRRESLRAITNIYKLPELFSRVKELEKELAELKRRREDDA